MRRKFGAILAGVVLSAMAIASGGSSHVDAATPPSGVAVVVLDVTPDGFGAATGTYDPVSIAEAADQVLADLGLDGFGGPDADVLKHLPVMRVTGAVDLDALRSHPLVAAADPTAGGAGHLADVVPLIGADHSHTAGFTGSGVTVAVLDTGVDSDHPDLVDDVNSGVQACFGWDPSGGFCHNGSDRDLGPGSAEDDAGHGTHVSGIITSGGVTAPLGVAPDAEIAAIKVLDNCGLGGCFYDAFEIVAALDFILDHPEIGIDIVNLSLGTNAQFAEACDDTYSWTTAGALAVGGLRAAGVTVIASAGNSGSTTHMGWPGCLSEVISVGASDDFDNAAGFSQSNQETDVFAPGVGVVAPAMGGGTLALSGTSMAAPATAGCAALLLSSGEVSTSADLESRLQASSAEITVAAHGRSFPRIWCGSTGPAACFGAPVTVDIAAGDTPTAGADVILGTSGDDVINGLDGDDIICGNGGNDTLLGAGGDDIVLGGPGNDQLSGNAGDDVLVGYGGDDDLYGGSGSDRIDGGAGNDLLGGSSGIDRLNGGSGNDVISGGSDDDSTINGDGGLDAVNGGSDDDDDDVHGGQGDDTVSGNGGNDVLFGSGGNDAVRGGPKDDVVYGGAGDDFVAGNDGIDVCDGGVGVDTANASSCETLVGVP